MVLIASFDGTIIQITLTLKHTFNEKGEKNKR